MISIAQSRCCVQDYRCVQVSVLSAWLDVTKDQDPSLQNTKIGSEEEPNNLHGMCRRDLDFNDGHRTTFLH